MSFCFCPLRSGSNGNVLFAQAGDCRILIDAGLSAKTVEGLLQEIEAPAETLSALFVTHEHLDHAKGVAVLSKRWNLPVCATAGTWREMDGKGLSQGIDGKNRHVIAAGQTAELGGLRVRAFEIPHDAAEPVGYTLSYGGGKICVATDLGHLCGEWMEAAAGSDLLLLESNHDPERLRMSRYPASLRARIAGDLGHLSNEACAEALARLLPGGITQVVLGHLSGETNDPQLARATVTGILAQKGFDPERDLKLDVAARDCRGRFYELV